MALFIKPEAYRIQQVSHNRFLPEVYDGVKKCWINIHTLTDLCEKEYNSLEDAQLGIEHSVEDLQVRYPILHPYVPNAAYMK